jgi:anti-sigma B factor antagonist
MSLSYELDDREGIADVRLSGRIDRDAASVFEDLATATAASSIIRLDFAGVDYINSTGIALIVGLLARARSNRIPVHAAGLTAHYRHIFDITRLSDFIEIAQPARP